MQWQQERKPFLVTYGMHYMLLLAGAKVSSQALLCKPYVCNQCNKLLLAA
jgi:hypothetical protein